MQDFLPLITGGGGALVVLSIVAWAFYIGKLHSDREFSKLETENDQLRSSNEQYRLALEAERRTLNETAQAGAVTNQLIAALTSLATGAKPPAPPPGLTAKDLGLS